MSAHTVTKMHGGRISDTGTAVMLEFSTKETAEPIRLAFDLKTLMGTLTDAAGLVAAAQRKSPLLQAVVAAVPAAKYKVTQTDDGASIIVSFQLKNALEHHFALSSKAATNLGKHIAAAVQGGKGEQRQKLQH
jgi:hypothetical protein